jgi:PAS domain S-box-containing protein
MLRMAMRVGRIGAWTMRLPQRGVAWAEGGRAIHGLKGGPVETFDAILERTAPECRAPLIAAVDACADEGTRFDLELRLLPGELPGLWVRLIGEADRAADGRVVGVQGTLEDINERKLAAERTRELGVGLVAMLDTAAEGFATVNREWRFTYANQEAEKMLRRSRTDLLGRTLWQEFPPAGTQFDAEYRRALERQEVVEIEEFFASASRWLRIKACPSPQGLAIYFRDVTDAHSVREALLQSQSQLHRLFENTLDGVLYMAPEGRILDANPAACAMLRMERDRLRETGCEALVPRQDLRLRTLLDERSTAGRARGELRLLRADGTSFEADASLTEYEGPDGSVHTFTVFHDISERVRAQREVMTLNAELGDRVRQRTEELERANGELKAFAHSLAHDLRAPVSAIEGFSAMLERSLPEPLPERSAHYLRRIRAQARKMDQYTEGLLSLARVSQQPMRVEPVDLSALAEDILAQLHEREPARKVDVRVQAGLAVRGDAILLRMALDNLLGNAWKFTGRLEEARIEFTAAADPAGELVYCVADNGAGFDMEYAGKLFHSFQRLHTQGEFPGTGIGLANVQRIVARHGGRIRAEAEEGAGARFMFTLATAPA